MNANIAVIALLTALVIDRWWGEPRERLHPVVWMGHYLVWAGRRIAPGQPHAGADWRAFWAGGLAWSAGVFGVLLLSHLAVGLVVGLATLAPFDDAWGVELLAGVALGALLKPMLAWRRTFSDVAAAEQALAQSLDAGRERLSRLVGRDVSRLSESEVRESAIASLADNLNDAVVAPLFWFVLLGLPGAAAYRFANTAGAMWGYPGLRGGRYWTWAGQWAARADDALSWLPAQLTAGTLALGVRLGKPRAYVLHAAGRVPVAADTWRALALAQKTAAGLAGIACAAIFLIADGA